MNKMPNLKYIIENESFIIRPFLPTDQFVLYCRDREVQTSQEQLEQFEKLGIFYPIARVRYRKIKIKIEYIDEGKRYRDLGELKDGEEWSGDIKEEYAPFWFQKEYTEKWLKEGLLWEPSSQPFQAWETFNDENGFRQIKSFYSIFQCYTLYNLIQSTRLELGMEYVISRNKEDLDELIHSVGELAQKIIAVRQQNGIREEAAVTICQIISNRYFPKTQSDRRSIQLSIPGRYHDWDYHQYCRRWDAKAVLNQIGINIDELKQLQELVATVAEDADPLEQWYGLVRFVSVEKKEKLKDKALLAQTLYSMEEMLRLFYEEVTGNRLHPPDESPNWKKDKFYGEGVTQNELKYLEFLANQYHLNPRPKLILMVEGDGEYKEFPRLAQELFGHSFPRLGIEVVKIGGIGGFEGKKDRDRCGALERFIDDYHYRQTIVFVILDKEGRVPKVKEQLLRAASKYYNGPYPKRRVTKDEYIHLWDKNIEFDNFSHVEIARAMTKLCEDKCTFEANEIENCKNAFDAKEGNPLGELFREKLGRDLPKPKLLSILFGFIISNRDKEFDAERKAKRPVVRVMQKVIKLAVSNYQPVTTDTWRENQESGYFGAPID